MPRWGGILISTPAVGSRPAITLQKDILVFTPTPRGAGQLTSAGSFFRVEAGGAGGLLAGGLVV